MQALFGHKSPKTTARYADASREKIVAAVQRIDRAWTGSSSARSQAAQSHAYLRGPEQDVLREYEKYAKEPNVASELPTGTDKTTVGLLIAEWHRRMDKRVAFLSLTNQLAGQCSKRANA